ncbi:hypothetical protein ACJX0J_036893, partial [Zea mays]
MEHFIVWQEYPDMLAHHGIIYFIIGISRLNMFDVEVFVIEFTFRGTCFLHLPSYNKHVPAIVGMSKQDIFHVYLHYHFVFKKKDRLAENEKLHHDDKEGMGIFAV